MEIITLDYHLFGRAVISIQNPIRLNDLSEPEPDVVVLSYREDGYAAHMPTAEDVLFLIEVSDSTLAYDRLVKRPLYARSGIPEYWLVNLIDNSIEVYRKPEEDYYAESLVIYMDEEISAVAFPKSTFRVKDFIK